jgi:non-ribosomal peptide synthetase component F/thioesterase domain-containing protein
MDAVNGAAGAGAGAATGLDDLLAELSRRGVRLARQDGGQLAMSAPKGSLPEALLGRIRDHKAGLLAWLARAEAAAPAGDALPVIEPDPGRWHEPFGLGDLQTAFAMGDGPDMEHHVRPHYYVEKDRPGLDVARYEAALNAALHRQRANLPLLTGDLRLQVPGGFEPVRLRVHDLRGLPEEVARQRLAATRERLARRTLPLDRWPWFDCEVSLHGSDSARLHWNNNNFFSDGYGTYRLLADIDSLYERPHQPLPELRLSYRDCILALDALERSPLGQRSRAYWEDRLPQLPPAPPLPWRAGLDPRRRSKLERRERVLGPRQWDGFQALARGNGLTPTSALFALHAEVLARWSGSRHFLLNNMVTHRHPLHPQIKDIVGNFASLYPLEVDWRQGSAFRDRALRLQRQATLDLQHAYFSGVKVLQGLNQAHKTPGRASCPFVVGSGLFMEPLERPPYDCLETPQTVLDHQFWALKDGGCWLVWDVIEDCFPEGLVDAMWAAHGSLLEALARDPQAWEQAGFDLLPEDQRLRRACVNETAAPLPGGLLHGGLARAAQRWPDKAAVVDAQARLTYAQLNRRVNRLAHRLLAQGVQPGDRVAVVLGKGWPQAVAVLGTLAANAAYVPIDPGWPAARIQMLIQGVQARVALTSQALRPLLAWPAGTRPVCVDGDDGENAAGAMPGVAQDAPPSRRQPTDLAYIIFTSGSTGAPKGVMIDHRGALNTVLDVNRRFGITENDVLFGVSSLCFDLSVHDLFGTLHAGATLVLPEETGETPRPDAWLASMRAHGVTVWNSVPALMQLVVDASEGSTYPTTAGSDSPTLSVRAEPVEAGEEQRAGPSTGSGRTEEVGAPTYPTTVGSDSPTPSVRAEPVEALCAGPQSFDEPRWQGPFDRLRANGREGSASTERMEGGDGCLPALRLVLLSGDWIPVTLPAQVAQRLAPDVQVVSLGGATEASVWSIFHAIGAEERFGASVPYGRPLANQRWHVLHDDGGEAPDWVPGQLHIAGAGLALGYWQDEARTEAAFAPHPISGERLYRTGDLGRWRPDGRIEFLGRADFQVKVQGYRVEPGEIEQALLALPGVLAAAVIAQGRQAGKQLLAFAVVDGGDGGPSAEALLAGLRQRLPAYMVPSRLVRLDRLPLTANGKVDRQALAGHGASDPATGASRPAPEPPRSPLEAALVAIWEEVLDLRPVFIHDDFFELGGQSFAAVRVMTRLAQRLGAQLPLSALIESRTVAQLARRLQREGASWTPLAALQAQGQGTPCFLVHPAGGHVLCYRALADGLGRPVHGLQAAGLHGEQPALADARGMAALYLKAVRGAQPRGPYLLGGWSSGGVIAFEMARQLEQQGEAVRQVVLIDTPAPTQAGPIDGGTLALWFLQDLDIGFDPACISAADLPAASGDAGSLLAAALALMQTRQGLAPALALPELLPIFEVFRGVIHATRRYAPAPVRAALSVLKAQQRHVAEYAGHPASDSDDWGWGPFTTGGVRCARVPGSHYTLLKPPNLAPLLAALRAHLAGAEQDDAPCPAAEPARPAPPRRD